MSGNSSDGLSGYSVDTELLISKCLKVIYSAKTEAQLDNALNYSSLVLKHIKGNGLQIAIAELFLAKGYMMAKIGCY